MATAYDLEHLLFLDIETVPMEHLFTNLPDPWKALWERKAAVRYKSETPEEAWAHAGIFAEFGRVICISAGYFFRKNNQWFFRVRSFYGDDEKVILSDFADLLTAKFQKAHHNLVAHNGKEFDFPFLARRMVINQIPLPTILQVAGKEPWKVKFIDTMELWKFGDFKHYTSLELLAACLQIPTPKADLDGSQIKRVYYEDHDLARISRYCQNDVVTVARIFLRYKNLPPLADKQIDWVTD